MKSFLGELRKYIKEADMLLFLLCFLSSIYGMVLVFSVTRGLDRSYMYMQIISTAAGIILFAVLSLIDIDIIAGKSALLYILSVGLIGLLLVWGVEGDTGNKSWLRFGGFGLQPSEIVKIPFIIVLARMMTVFKERRALNSPLSLLQMLGMSGFLFGLILVFSADLGSASVYLFILIMMLFMGGVSAGWLLAGLAAAAALSPLVWSNLLSDRQRNLIMAPYFPELVDKKIVWHANQSRQAIASGGFLGQGLFNGQLTQTQGIPQQHTDFIFSAAGEELGFVGCVAIILLLLGIIIRCIYVGVKSNNTLGLLVCVGVASMFLFQTLENIGMCLRLTPVVGITLPFFSYGGSSAVTNFIAVGLVCGIKMRPKPPSFRTMNY